MYFRFLADFDGCYQVQVYLDIITQSACNVYPLKNVHFF